MTRNDPYLTQSIEALGRRATIIALQNYAASEHARYQRCRDRSIIMHIVGDASAEWAYRQARILMGIE